MKYNKRKEIAGIAFDAKLHISSIISQCSSHRDPDPNLMIQNFNYAQRNMESLIEKIKEVAKDES